MSGRNEASEALERQGIRTEECLANRTNRVREIIVSCDPHICVFDRYYVEEAFSFHVRDHAPAALRVLDMQDCHALRRSRQRAVQRGCPWWEMTHHRPVADDTNLLRELAAIHRSDLSLVCSPVEMELLAEAYGVPRASLALAPFFIRQRERMRARQAGERSYAERRHFMTIGNFQHPPNMDSLEWLADSLWRDIRGRLPPEHRQHAELHVYGAYPSARAQQLSAPEAGLKVMGFAQDLPATLSRYRVCLAPLRFGAGLKGKVVESWLHGLPVCTTAVGAEGLRAADYPASELVHARCTTPAEGPETADWGGVWQADSQGQLSEAAARLYSGECEWQQAQHAGWRLVEQLFDWESRMESVMATVEQARGELLLRRSHDYMGQMLWQQTARCTEYFSRWIELKETGWAPAHSRGEQPKQDGRAAPPASDA